VLLGTACATATVLLAPPSARALLWVGSLTVVSVFAGLLLGRIERRTDALDEAYRGTLDIMSRLIDSAERHPENHSRRVAESSVEVAHVLGCSQAEVEDVRVAALLHDLGKLDIPAEALAEAAGLAPEELDEIGLHGRRGGRTERDARGALRRVIPMVACCQERWDGTGRRSLRGPEIPLGARILAVADAYDTIVTDRAYQRGRTHEEALAALREASGTQFDPRVVEVFLALRAEPAGSLLASRAA
jgi:HD-GYP domain-containing protein (c-di-GMP phosphodiesterase class II)